MLKKSSRPVSTKQSLMADPFPSPPSNYNKPLTSPLFPLSPRAFVGFSQKVYSDNIDVVMSPTSILETKTNPFFSEKNPRKSFIDQTQVTNNHEPVGLGIVDALEKPESRMVLFGSQLKIQIPQIGLIEAPPQSPIEFGIKNRESQLALISPVRRTPMGSCNLVSGCISVSEMEMSEDYTCVIAHGPNPKTTHIFDNCIVECCGDGFAAVTPKKGNGVVEDFLSSCDACKKKLGEGKDIFIYSKIKKEKKKEKMVRKKTVEFDKSPPDFDHSNPYDDSVAMLDYREHLVREKWIQIETTKIIREKLKWCYRIEGVNHLQKCCHLVDQYLESTRGVGWGKDHRPYEFHGPKKEVE